MTELGESQQGQSPGPDDIHVQGGVEGATDHFMQSFSDL